MWDATLYGGILSGWTKMELILALLEYTKIIGSGN